MPASSVQERLAAGDARGALCAAEQLLVKADEANDKSLVALAQQLAGGALALEGRHGEAAARLEDAAELFHEMGDTTHEIQTLERLANAYRALDDESRVADAVARKQTMQSPSHQQHQQPPQRHEGDALGDSGDSRSPPTEPPAPASESKLLGMLRSRSGAEHRAWQLREVEADKQVLRELRSVLGGLSRSDDDAHLQSHMKQVRFADLPGAAVEARLQDADQAMTALEQRVSRFYRCLRELVWVSSAGKESGKERAEAAGSLSAALEGWDECAVEWGCQADRRSQEIKNRVLVPLGKMRVSYRGICEHFSGLTGSLARAATSAADEVSAARKAQARARSKVAEAEASLDACRSLPGDEGGSPKMTFSESMGALLGARRLSAQERAAEALRKAQAESDLADSAAFVSQQRLEAALGALAVARRQAARELEAVEQVRLDIFAGMLRELSDTQTALLAGWQDATRQLAARVQLVDTASDLRTHTYVSRLRRATSVRKRGPGSATRTALTHPLLLFLFRCSFVRSFVRSLCALRSNRTLIRAVLEGKAAPTTLLCPPPFKYRQASSGPRLDEKDEAELEEEEAAEGQDKQGDPAPTRADALDSRDGVAGASEAAVVLPPEPPAVQGDGAGAGARAIGQGDGASLAQAQIDAFLARLSRHSDATDLGRPAQEQDRAADGAVVQGVMETFEQRASRDYFLRRLNTFRSTKTRVAKSVMVSARAGLTGRPASHTGADVRVSCRSLLCWLSRLLDLARLASQDDLGLVFIAFLVSAVPL